MIGWYMLLGLGGFLISGGILALYLAISNRTWPTTQGRIRASVLGHYPECEGAPKRYGAHVEYDYRVGDRAFSSTRIALDHFDFGLAHTQYVLNKYPVGKPVTVYYDPKHPKVSVLEHNSLSTSYILLSIGLALFGLGLFGVL
jgi:hypothetical protein